MKFQTYNVQREGERSLEKESNSKCKQKTYVSHPNFEQNPCLKGDLSAQHAPKEKPFISQTSYQLSSKKTQPLKHLGSYNEFRYLNRKPPQSLNMYPQTSRFPTYDSHFPPHDLAFSKAHLNIQRSPAVSSNPFNVNTSFAYIPQYTLGCSDQQVQTYYSSAHKASGLNTLGDDVFVKEKTCYGPPPHVPSHKKPTHPQEAYLHPHKFHKGHMYGRPPGGPVPQNSFGTLSSYCLPGGQPPASKKESSMITSEGNFGKATEIKGLLKPPLKHNSLSSLPGPVDNT